MKKIYALLATIFIPALADTDAAISELEKTLLETTEIATIKKMNVDYVPSVVSVLKNEQLKAVGVHTVYDALGLLPGVQMQVNQFGESVSVVRGFKNPNAYLSDKIKVMLDGVAVNSETYGSAGFIMDMPIDIVDRIEVLRGPGSTVYGSGAFYGAVNIITKSASRTKKCNEIFAGFGSYSYSKAGFLGCVDKNGVRYSSDAYYQGSDRKLQVDKSYTDVGAKFARAYETNEGFDDFSAGFNLQSENITWNTRVKKSWQGNYYGLEERLEPRDDTGHVNQLFYSEVAYRARALELKAGVKDHAYQINAIARDQSFLEGRLPGFDYNYNYRVRAAETTVYTEALYRFSKALNHSVSVGAELSHTALRENYFWSATEDYAFAKNPALFYTQPAKQFAQNNELLKDKISRSSGSLYAEDVYEASENIDIALGFRADKHSDLDAQFSSRIGVAARWFDNSLITKFIYSLGHRAPTFYEKYAKAHINFRAGDDFLKPEDIKSYEAVLIYKPNQRHTVSLNAYYSELNNVIDIEEDGYTTIGHANYPKRLSKGVEVEYTYKQSDAHELHLNYSLNKTTYLNTANLELQDMPDISPSMYKAWYVYRPMSDLTFGLKYMIFAKSVQNSDFTNKDTTVAANHIADFSARYKPTKNSEIALSINNLLDKTVRMPSYYYRNFQGRNDGMIREGRGFLIELKRSF